MHTSTADPLYNPATETESEEEVIASRWELLRRNTEFQAVAQKWVASASFRNSHALTREYCDFGRIASRCALDWMLTPQKRFHLAQIQIKRRTWQLGKSWNFGPIIWAFRNPAPAMSRKTAYDSIEVKLLENAPKPITFSEAWDSVSERFKRQFRFAVQPQKPAFASINKTIEAASLRLGVIARKLQAGDPLDEMKIMADFIFEHALKLHLLSGNYRLYRIARGDYSNKAFTGFLERIKQDFSGPHGEIFSGKKYDTHRSYLGTALDWKWFLEAERLGLDVKKSADRYRLAELYYEDLRQRSMRGQAHPHAKAHGFTGSRVSSKDKRDCRTAVKRHVLNIQKWIREEYLPLPTDPPRPVF